MALIAEGGHVHEILFVVALLVMAAKIGGLLSRRLGQPAVFGELLVGIGVANLLAPAVGSAASLRDDEVLRALAEMGGLILLFDVGLEADIRALARAGTSALLVAVIGVVTPFVLGWAASAALQPEADGLLHVFLGASLTATSVGITARVLEDMGAAATREGQTVLGAAVIDDVLGLVVLAVVTGAAAGGHGAPSTTTLGVLAILGKAALFLGITVLAGLFLSEKLVRFASRGQQGFLLVLGVTACFAMAHLAESIGLAGILGAFCAGILLDPYGVDVRSSADEHTLAEMLRPLSTVFVPLFFVVIGLQVDLASLLTGRSLLFGGILAAAAVAGKLVAGLGVVDRGVSRLAVGIGMVPRGEVGLVFAGIGTTLQVAGRPLLDGELFSALVVMVLVTTLVSPPWLRVVLARRAP